MRTVSRRIQGKRDTAGLFCRAGGYAGVGAGEVALNHRGENLARRGNQQRTSEWIDDNDDDDDDQRETRREQKRR